MSLSEKLKGYSINLSGEVSEETRAGIAKAVSESIDESEEKVITRSEVVDAVCSLGNVYHNYQKERIVQRYLSDISNRLVGNEFIYSILVREIIVELAKEGCFGELDLKKDAQINVREDKGAEFFTKSALLCKSKERVKAFVLRRVKKLPPAYNFMCSREPVEPAEKQE
ncbi:hypothetical protein A3K73_09475 [Candidatus Pacearchaeota archaeon RBG_13_36_9]|nr:MAG: hypothetical protein A3K73_09475 [Candidatus Pacearchaeota archaeon RBG_13_36_9]